MNVKAQVDNDDTGLWSEIVVTKNINKRVDAVFGSRYETKSNNSETQEFRFYGGVNIKFGKTSKWSVQPQYTFTRFQLRNGNYVNEHRPTVIVARRFQKKGSKWGFSLSSRNEFRIRPGKNDFRFVPGFSIEYALNKKTKLINRNELWFDTRKADPSQYRWRSFVAVNRVLSDNKSRSIALEPFVMFQKDVKFAPKFVVKGGFYLRITIK